jgi:sugar lactone lactonase YvrE
MFGRQIVAFSPAGSVERTLDVPGTPAGLSWDADERVVTVTADGAILRESRGRLVVTLDRIERGAAPCNELTIDRQGRAFIGIFGLRSGALLRVDPDGSQRVVATDLLLPNGQALTADGRTLIVAESAGQRVTAFTLRPDGQLCDRRVCAGFGRPATAATVPEVLEQVSVWPDGIALDAAGAIWVANPFGHEVFRVLGGGQVTNRISTRELSAYACALGGPDGRTLYICAAPPSRDETARRAQRGARLLAARVTTPAPITGEDQGVRDAGRPGVVDGPV